MKNGRSAKKMQREEVELQRLATKDIERVRASSRFELRDREVAAPCSSSWGESRLRIDIRASGAMEADAKGDGEVGGSMTPKREFMMYDV
jgi:hypothetical protein